MVERNYDRMMEERNLPPKSNITQMKDTTMHIFTEGRTTRMSVFQQAERAHMDHNPYLTKACVGPVLAIDREDQYQVLTNSVKALEKAQRDIATRTTMLDSPLTSQQISHAAQLKDLK
ncbi:MAG: hypothetical protein Q9190_002745 [Brigantiaea leucoxantha]